jgi:hypothetical protein
MLAVSNSTIAANYAATGGGIANAGSMTARDTILARNQAPVGPDLSGDLGSQGHNLIGTTQGGSGFDPSDLLNVDPILGALQDNGGPTWTMALLPGSPARAAGDTQDAPEFDQRGPGFARVVDGAIDIGAFEVQVPGANLPNYFDPLPAGPALRDRAISMPAWEALHGPSTLGEASEVSLTWMPVAPVDSATVDRLFAAAEWGFAYKVVAMKAPGGAIAQGN